MPRTVAILIVCYNGRDDLPDCLDALLADDEKTFEKQIVVVDNCSTDDSDQLVEERYPTIHLIRTHQNLGFAGGNNAGWQYIQTHLPNTDAVMLLNQDAIVQRDFLEPLMRVLNQQSDVAAVQPMLLLDGTDPPRLNSAGNRSHFLGFGYTTGYNAPATDAEFNKPRDIDFPSGAAVLCRTAALQSLGLFDDEMFMYMEDVDLGWKLRQAGRRVCYEPTSRVSHRYRFDSTLRAYQYLERNRLWVLLTYYHIASLILLFPAFIAMELGQLLFALSRGSLAAKLIGYGQTLRPQTLKHLIHRRREAQQNRKLSDRLFMGEFAGRIEFPEGEPALLKLIGNPILNVYWQVARALICW